MKHSTSPAPEYQNTRIPKYPNTQLPPDFCYLFDPLGPRPLTFDFSFYILKGFNAQPGCVTACTALNCLRSRVRII